MSALDISHLSLEIGPDANLRDISLTLPEGEIGCLLGPSGCGKTSLLRAIAGFLPLQQGSIDIVGKRIADERRNTAPEKRHVGMVFQDLALFPHLTLAENLAFGLRHQSRQERRARVQSLLRLVDLAGLDARYPHQLSGGQQQRAAVARAMAPRPSLLLLDEPFSSQDAGHREALARDIGGILRSDGIPALLVTHDQLEGFAMADRVGVMQQGQLLQWDNAFELYHMPTDRRVASFIGDGLFVCGIVLDEHSLETELGILRGDFSQRFPTGTRVELLVRPDDVIHDDASPYRATVVERSFRGANHLYRLRLPPATRVLCMAPSHHNHAIAEEIGVRLEMDHLVVFAQP